MSGRSSRSSRSRRRSARGASRATVLLSIGVAAAVTAGACKPDNIATVCEADRRAFVAERQELAQKGIAKEATDDELSVRREHCRVVIDSIKPGVAECMAGCYKGASDRGALFDCDRRCQVKLQVIE